MQIPHTHPRRLAPLAVLLAVLTASSTPLASETQAVSVESVLAMMDKVPVVEKPGAKPYAWSHKPQARLVARAIAAHAPTLESAAEMVVYAVRESALVITARGDHDQATGQPRSHGVWQLAEHWAPIHVAEDPMRAAPVWLAIAARSRTHCAFLPPDEQLAELASGNCGAGRQKARDRAEVARSLLVSDETQIP